MKNRPPWRRRARRSLTADDLLDMDPEKMINGVGHFGLNTFLRTVKRKEIPRLLDLVGRGEMKFYTGDGTAVDPAVACATIKAFFADPANRRVH